VQFIQDPSEARVKTPKWLAIFTAGPKSLSNLYAISANRAYLIHVTGSSPVTLNIDGRPTMRHKGWVPDSFNLTGFGLTSSPPTFATFFAPSKSHKDQKIYRLNNTSGAWEIVNNPSTAAMRSGEAFWIYCRSGSDYQGPLTVEADGADGLDFGAGITNLSLIFRNASTTDKRVTVSQSSAGNPVALKYKSYDVTSGHILTKPLPAMPAFTVKAGSTYTVTVEVQRDGFSGAGASGLEFSDADGGKVRVPVTATSNPVHKKSGLAAGIHTEAEGVTATSNPVNSYPGLWSGVATLNKVSQVSDLENVNSSAPTATPDFELPQSAQAKPTPAALNLNLILHQDRSGQVRLLKQAIVMYQDGTTNSDGTPRTKGRYVALTKDSLIPNYSGVTQRDGAKVGRRLSAVGFDYTSSSDTNFGTEFDGTALKCTGSISATVACQLILESSDNYTHPTNPFLHKYHPDHDNLAGDFVTFKPEVNRIQRDVTLAFDSTPKDNPTNPPPGWGMTVLGGTYTEYIRGLAKGPIMVEGNFTINLATDVDLLNE
jgi:hypothetical protein